MGRVSEYYLELSELNIAGVPDKYVCVRHFKDKHINNFISKNYTDGYCNYCKKSVKVLELEEVLKFMMKGINNFYEDAANFQPYNSREGGYLYGHSTPNELIQDEIGLETEPYKLTEDIIYSIADIAWCSYYDFYGSPKEMLERRWHYFSNTVKHQTRYFFNYRDSKAEYLEPSINAQDALKDLGEFINKYNLIRHLSSDKLLIRARQHTISDKIEFATQLVAPNIEFAQYANRFSPSGVPMFYGGFEEKTVIKEVYDSKKKSSHRRITIGYFQAKEKIRVIDLTKVPNTPGIFEPDRYEDYFSLNFLNQLVFELSKPVTLDRKDHIEYVPTQIITEYIRYPFNETKRKKIQGIIYPSAKADGKPCIVLFWNKEECLKKLKLIKTNTIKTSIL